MALIEETFKATVGRDVGKTFLITEMSPRKAHKWATRVLFAMLNSGIEIDEDTMDRGLAGVAAMAVSAIGKIPVEVAEPLMDELLACVQSVQEKATRTLIESDIEEAATIFQLQKAALMLHIQPFISGGLLTSVSAPGAGTQPA